MVIQIIKSVQVNNKWFVKGQEYESIGYENRLYEDQFLPCEPCDDEQAGRHYIVENDVDGETPYYIPWMFVGVLDQDTPDDDMRSYWALYDERALKDGVVKDGDYVKGAKEVLGIDISKHGPDYDQKRLAELRKLKELWEKV